MTTWLPSRAPLRAAPTGLLWIAILAQVLGCDDLDGFRTGEDAVFRGAVVGNVPLDAGTGHTGSRPFLLYGFDAATVMELRFDPAVVSTGGSPGSIDTFVCADGSLTGCPPEGREPGPLRRAELVQVVGLSDDVLSRYNFPGASRVRNYIFHAHLGDTEAGGPGRSAMVFLSLMESGAIEVRVVAAGDPERAAEAPPLFGLFRLERGER